MVLVKLRLGGSRFLLKGDEDMGVQSDNELYIVHCVEESLQYI